MYKGPTDIADQISGLCTSIRNETMFAEHSHLLVAALSALRSAQEVLGSLNKKDHALDENWISN